MTTGEWVIATATFLGPIMAVQAQKWIEMTRARRDRKLRLFWQMMASRSNWLSPSNIQALNMIEIEFIGKRLVGRHRPTDAEEAVLAAWRGFFLHINTQAAPDGGQAWGEHANDLLIQLLVAMGNDVGYMLKAADIKWHTYSPKGPAEDEQVLRQLRDEFLKLLTGRGVLPVVVRPDAPAAVPAQHAGG